MPIYLHLDGAELYSNSEFYVLSWSSGAAQYGHVLDRKFPLLKIAHCAMRDPGTKRKVFEVMAKYVAWDMQILAAGVVPEKGFYDEPLSAGDVAWSSVTAEYWGACAGFKADLKARKEAHSFKHGYMSIYCCDRCRATQPFPRALQSDELQRLLCSDVSAEAPWRSTRITHEDYVNYAGSSQISMARRARLAFGTVPF